ncbi:MAG TPA: hypothetical protein VE010_07190, partial [Thermoanaerobaculia bacterium]|nr:hypothetical protein [Thermoanaerobaculia bacterium]
MIDRTRFGSWGLELSDDELARAVAGALEQRLPRSHNAEEPLPVRAWRTPKHNAAHYRDSARAGTRFQVAPALLDIAELIARPASGAAAVFVESDAETSVVWTYPLRIGFLPGYRESEARELAQLDWPDAYQQVELSATASECDILVLPGNLRSSLAALLERKLTIHADCVLVLGTLDESGERALRLIDVLRDAADAGGVAVANQPRAKRVQWFHEFLRALAHDQPLDRALFAQNATSEHPPLLVASRKLIDATRISTRVRNVTEHVRWYETTPMETAGSAEGTAARPVSLE